MALWNKKTVNKNEITPLCDKYGIDQILASIFVRRNITRGKDILYYLENDLRFQNEPFLLPNIDDAVIRITQAKEENEKVLIFGDSDVDGITSTAILYSYLKKIGLDVSWRLPLKDDPYGLSMDAVNDFYNQGGTLIITVDCGISNVSEIQAANEKGIDVIVTDHHNPPENLPEAIVLIDPKLEDSKYPFRDVSGACVAYKLVNALKFSFTSFYNLEISIFEIKKIKDEYFIDCLKIKNLIRVKELHEKITPGITKFSNLKFTDFLQGQLIYSWNVKETTLLLQELFGSSIQVNLNDLNALISSVMPKTKNKSISELKKLSSTSKYDETENSDLNCLYNLYLTFVKKSLLLKNPEDLKEEHYNLQLVGLAALADIMPMKNENRIFVKNCVSSIKKDSPRPGLAELFSKLQLNPQNISSIDLSWSVIPALNAAGRLGQADVSLKLLLSESPAEREKLAINVYELNELRKKLVSDTVFKIRDKAEQSIKDYNNKLCLVVDEAINPGLTGLIAGKLVTDFNIPSIAVTFNNDICIGSIRSTKNFIATDFLNNFGDFFINHGGHNQAAGFSFYKEKLQEFLNIVNSQVQSMKFVDEEKKYEIDAEIPCSFMTPDLFKLIDYFEPYGNENPELTLLTKGITLFDAVKVGKKDPLHLKVNFDSGKYKFPGMFWGNGERLGKDIFKSEKYDIIYAISRNYYNGNVQNQLVIKEIKNE